MIKKYLKKYIPIIILFFVFSVSFVFAQQVCGADHKDAQGNVCYVLLEKDAFAGFNSTSTNPLVALLTNVFNFGIAIAIVSALVMIIWGGIIKMTTDSWQGQDEAKTKFTNALYGLGLALIAYIILYTINPCLVLFGQKEACNNQLLFPITANQQTGTNGAANTTAGTQLAQAGIQITSSGGCDTQTKSTCTSLTGLPQSAIDGLIEVQKNCSNYNPNTKTGGCITMTGGTEVGHTYHGPGQAVVDVSYTPQAVQALEDSSMTNKMNYQYDNTYVCERYNKPLACSSCDAYIGTEDKCHIHIQWPNQ
jgi:hypothetical protein